MKFKNSISAKESYTRILELQPTLHAAITMIEPRENQQDGKLSGIPVVLKDNISTKGIKTTAGSQILSDYVPVYNATIVDKLEKEGAIFVCKANMDELGMGDTNKNDYTGTVCNPYDLQRICGGSSGGCAALVAANCTPLAIGTDTGDSIRRPAAFTGVVGVKPTYGRISRYGIIPYASSLDTVGYLTTSVKDAAIALEVLAGHDSHDMTSSFEDVSEYSKGLSYSLKEKKIAIFKTVVDACRDEYIKKVFNDYVEKLKQQGAIISYVEMPKEYMELISPVYKTIANAEATANHSNLDGIRFGMRKKGETVEDVMIQSRTQGFSSYVRARFLVGSYSLFEENQNRLFKKAQKIRRLLVQSYSKCFEDVDGVLTIACDEIAPLIEISKNSRFEQEPFVTSHLQLANFSGYPSITLPLSKKEGMPFGINLTCLPFKEELMFDLASGLESQVKPYEV